MQRMALLTDGTQFLRRCRTFDWPTKPGKSPRKISHRGINRSSVIWPLARKWERTSVTMLALWENGTLERSRNHWSPTLQWFPETQPPGGLTWNEIVDVLLKSLPMPPFFAHPIDLCSMWMVPQVKWLFLIFSSAFPLAAKPQCHDSGKSCDQF